MTRRARRARSALGAPARVKTGLGLGERLILGLACLAFLAVMFVVFDRGPRVRHVSDSPSSEAAAPTTEAGRRYACGSVTVVDGDTLRCDHRRVRLASIDAPEMQGHCRAGRVCTPGDPIASTKHLKQLVAGGPVSCREVDIDAYGRSVAFCTAKGKDLSCGQVKAGVAVVRYGDLSCG